MTLNASGPLSLGGATTGQSINLELGQAATATASINATNFRTLAGVASGQISVSNFYGKSNTFGWISYVSGAGNQASTTKAFFADPSGNTYFSYKGNSNADFNSLAKLNSSGTTATYLSPWADSFLSVNTPPHSSLYTSDANFFASASSSDLTNYPYSTINSSLGYQSGKLRQGSASYPHNVALTPDGRVYVLGRYFDKAEPARIFSFTTSGALVGGWVAVSAGSSNSGVAPRTDNGAFWVYKTGQQIKFASLPAGGGATTGGNLNYSWSDGGNGIAQAATDSSNNCYAVTDRGWLIKINSTGSSASAIYPTANSTGNSTAVSVYGSFVYVLFSVSNTVMYLYCYNTSLTAQWVNSFSFSGATTNISSTRGRLQATAAGVFMLFNNNTYGNFIMKVPLTGVPSNSSKALTAPAGVTFNWTTGSFTTTSLGIDAVNPTNVMSTFAYTAVTTSAYPSGSVTAPANTNTTL